MPEKKEPDSNMCEHKCMNYETPEKEETKAMVKDNKMSQGSLVSSEEEPEERYRYGLP